MAFIFVNSNNDPIDGAPGSDSIDGDNRNNTISGGAGRDFIYGKGGNDNLFGGTGDDIIYGDDGNDSVYGDEGNDELYGGFGDDTLIGGSGNDTLQGGAGNDILIGVDPLAARPGIGEKDYLDAFAQGGTKLIVLGDANNIYYDDGLNTTDGANDFAEIPLFNSFLEPNSGKVQLQGAASNYLLKPNGANTGLYIDKPGSEPDELIALFTLRSSGAPTLDLQSSAFQYVAKTTSGTTPPVVTPPATTPPVSTPAANFTNNLFSTNGSIKGLGLTAVSQKSSNKVNEIAAFYVDDATGKIGNLAPGAAGYVKAALDRAIPIFSPLGGSFFNKTDRQDVAIDTGKFYSLVQIQDGTIADLKQKISLDPNFVPTNILQSFGTNSPIKFAENSAKDGYQVSINNDELVLNVIGLTSAPTPPIGSKSQYLAEGRTIDLTDSAYAGKTLKVDITTKSDAAYNDNIGFYEVQDAAGTIRLADGTSIGVGDSRYALEAVKKAIGNALLTANKTESKIDRNIAGGILYAPVAIAKGTLDDFVKAGTNTGDANAIHAYFNYVGANPDKVDHFRLLGSNTFGVEDLYGGGDRDFNDIVVNLNVKAA